MSTPTINKEVVRAAVCSAERFRYHVPFDTMEKAKEFVGTLCEANEFDYGLLVNTPESTRRAVVDRVHFFVALNAFNRGEFVIPEMFPNPKKLHDAVEADVIRLRAASDHFMDAEIPQRAARHGLCGQGVRGAQVRLHAVQER